MKKLYKYTGAIGAISCHKTRPGAVPSVELELYDPHDDDKAPIRIDATGGLADYLLAREWTDAEERYLQEHWYYDRTLSLIRIEVPSTEPGKPAKVIAQRAPWEAAATIFGPSDLINTPEPAPMDAAQLQAWCLYKMDDEYRYRPATPRL